MVRAESGSRWRPDRVEVIPLILLPISAIVLGAMAATDIGGAAGRRLLESPVLIVPTVLLFAALTCVLCLRRRFPIITYTTSVAITAVMMLVLRSASLGISPMYWFAAVALGMRAQGWRLVAAMIGGIAVDSLVSAWVRVGSPDGGEADFSSQLWVALFNATLTTTALVMLGAVIAAHRRQVASGATELEHARHEHESRIARAVEAERASMARELHDMAAHHLAAMLIQARNAERLLEQDPAKAQELLSGVIGQGRRTLDGLRQIVGILRMPDGAGVPPQPTIADIASLVEGFRTMFADVHVAICRDSADVDSGVQLACYRIVQESLSNASRYALRSRAVVKVERAGDAMVITVLNDAGSTKTIDTAADAHGQGLGIVGMRERVAILGGSIDAHAVDDGWAVRAELPVHGRIAV
ncbi:MAG: histidine kinase [Rhodococcus sp. (in: high G+C Gram-positive bacteria)]